LQVILFICIFFSLFVGNFTAILQTKLKRLFAYSTISHLGFIFTALFIGSLEAFYAFFFYLVVYFIIMIPVFIIIMYLSDFSTSLKRNSPLFLRSFLDINPVLILCFTFLLLSLGGLPPLLGFFSKFIIIYCVLSAMYYPLAFILILFSSVGFFYYLQFVIYVWARKSNFIKILSIPLSFVDSFIIIYFSLFNIFFFFFHFILLILSNYLQF